MNIKLDQSLTFIKQIDLFSVGIQNGSAMELSHSDQRPFNHIPHELFTPNHLYFNGKQNASEPL